MPRRPLPRATRPRPGTVPAAPARRGVAIGLGVAILLVAAAWWVISGSVPGSARDRDLAEAREALGQGRAAVAAAALARASAGDPRDPEPWLLRLEILRLEDRQVEAQALGWEAFAAVPVRSRREVLRALTLALLADAPQDVALSTLARWVAADPNDLDARVALSRRAADSPRPDDPGRSARVMTLTGILAAHPSHVAAREALVLALADAGDPDRGRLVLEAWPESARDARYHRLAGRWALEYDRSPARAMASLSLALEALPHDWRTRARLARAQTIAGLDPESRSSAEAVARLRDTLNPLPLGRRLDADLAALDDPKSRLDLADLCDRVGLKRLAHAWREDARSPGAEGVDPLIPGPPRRR